MIPEIRIKRLIYKLLSFTPFFLCRFYVGRMILEAEDALLRMKPCIDAYIDSEVEKVKRKVYFDRRLRVQCMIGLPQTGKTTLANMTALACGYVSINNNLIRDWSVACSCDSVDVNAIAFYMMEEVLKRGCSVVMDSDCAHPLKRRLIESIAMKYNADSINIQVTVDSSVYIERLRRPEHVYEGLYHRALRAICVQRFGCPYENLDKRKVQDALYDIVAEEWKRQVVLHYDDWFQYSSKNEHLKDRRPVNFPVCAVVTNNESIDELKMNLIRALS